jgi:hypothetical protein
MVLKVVMTHKFNEETANELVDEIGQIMLGDEALDNDDWEALSQVIQLDGIHDTNGFIYHLEGNVSPSSPDKTEILAAAKELQKVMTVDGVTWKAVLVQITLPEFEVKVAFEYDTATKWPIQAEALRPDRVEY